MRETAESPLARAIRPLTEEHPAASGIVPLQSGHDALAARVLLADGATRTIDARYYIWRDDTSGSLLFGSLYRAAERGVRVRLLLDDNNTMGLDALLAALDAHPNVEVRLFNPFAFRSFRILSYLTDFFRLNRRMHNKSFTADDQATIVGGRNVGDEYFDLGDGIAFSDLDVLAVGPVVDDVRRDFERYWSSASSHFVAAVLPRAEADSVVGARAALLGLPRRPAARPYVAAIADSSIVRDLLAGELPFEWAPVRMVSDDPAKGLGRARRGGLLWPKLEEVLKSSSSGLHLISAYFVPGAEGVETLASLASRGVEVAILTNSLEATDVGAVHAGYAKRRKALLRAGVRLFEMRRGYAPRRGARVKRRGGKGSSKVSLHAKTFSVDGSTVFLGSFNFDPRSAALNTEMGFLIESPGVARAIAGAFDAEVPARSYEVRLGPKGRLLWIARTEDGEITLEREPGAGFWRRRVLGILSVLPVEWLL